MDLTSILLALLPTVIPQLAKIPGVNTAITDVVGALKLTTGPATPVPPNSTATAKKPSEFVRTVQHLYNQYAAPAVPLVEDGWLGTKTEKALAALAAPYGIIIPVDA